ncbi:MAG: (Na+)-NQR maturation NqrM [Cellvibrionaceae bacterium]|nr:(Na+)-NQR maturation NqrM [Cellvibrionaceae bacterium]
MMTLLLAFLLLAFIIAAMSIGVILGRKPISGSCGGVGAALGEKDYSCELCGGDPNKCEEQGINNSQASALAVDASVQNDKA